MNSEREVVRAEGAQSVLSLLPPYPIVLVTTQTNIITVGQIQYFTLAPLRIGIAIAHSRHSHKLIKQEREFVVNVPDARLLEAVKTCGSVSGRAGDKYAAAGLTRIDSTAVKAASIAECGAHIECVVEREIEFEKRTWFVGTVAAASKRPDHQGAHSLLCGRTAYHVPGEVVAPR